VAVAPTSPSRELAVRDLPPGFVLGTATSAAQIEGAASAAGRGRSIWDALAMRPGAIAGGVGPGVGCDHWHRWAEDLDLLADLGVDAYRFSIAWPRIQPNGVGPALTAGLDFYDRLVDGLLERGIAPNVTLYHWDLPAALEDDLGGWRHRDVAGRFSDYATLVARRLADRVAWWATLNEPWCSAFLGYGSGRHAPGVQDEAGSVRAAHHLLLGHGMAVQALRAAGASNVGIVVNLNEVRPASDRPGDVDAAERIDGTQNRWWLGALAGEFPQDVVASIEGLVELEELAPEGDAQTVAEPLDWIGVNTYYPIIARAGDDPTRKPAGPGLHGTETVPAGPDQPGNMLGWHIDSTGAEAVLHQAHRFLPELPIHVTENGIPLRDEVGPDGDVDDPARIAYLQDHLAATLRARADGVPVEGYHAWSLLDNFEWAEGYDPRFGLVHVDFDTMVRTPKASFRWLQQLLAERG
jgi:beta-glucosidase